MSENKIGILIAQLQTKNGWTRKRNGSYVQCY